MKRQQRQMNTWAWADEQGEIWLYPEEGRVYIGLISRRGTDSRIMRKGMTPATAREIAHDLERLAEEAERHDL
ncbi:hypothetical protein GCM10007416_31430 [Kroppenstedtia guangzhouensis]|uniref:Uncharacterized protein n=1 Tax=Kroppenstedtia guangzhouensis TaxID=1274356 RepID=A0ABQ1H300_9BACL|nr:hypothetical protein [Kroppenstedtia guangzhouensis]GGA55956.1 hypothetical protein GCM10007416_31430 [Kroppenstedtia guangzhouensis]